MTTTAILRDLGSFLILVVITTDLAGAQRIVPPVRQRPIQDWASINQIPTLEQESSIPISDDSDPHRHRVVLDPRGRYLLEWLVDFDNSRVVFNTTVQTLGYIGLGLSRKGRMEGADLIVGGVDSNGSSYFRDMHVEGRRTLVEDINQDWILHSAWENQTHTFLSFSRPFDTCDEHDLPITDDVNKIIWSFSERDNMTEYHHQNRGTFTVYLRDPDLTPRVVHETGRNDDSRILQGLNNEGNVQIWSLRDRLQIPPKRTTYWCNIHKLSLPRKHHIIGFKFHINPEAQKAMHHLLIFRCNVPLGINPALIYEPFVNYPGEECYSQNMPLGKIPVQACVEVKGGHAIGGVPFFIPDHVGIPVGETNVNEYFLMQTHYDNEDLRTNLTADIQFDVYYTDNIRENDAGILSLGQHIPGSPSLLLPPGQINHRFYGHCSSACTERMLPPEGIKVVAALLHTHLTGRRLRIQHFRNNRELPWILNDDNYEPLYQPFRLLREEATILPGDQVSMQCYYDTSERNRTTVGGYGTDQEMCKTFMLYYNRLEDYIMCRSEIVSDDYSMRYLAGTFNDTWDQSQLEFRSTIATNPLVIGMTLSEISDSPHVNWTIGLRARLQRDHIVEPQISICPSIDITSVLSQVLPFVSKLLPREYVSYPLEATPYEPQRRCSLA